MRVGDTYTLRSDLEDLKVYGGQMYIKEMLPPNTKVTIRYISEEGYILLEEDENASRYSKEMLEEE